MMSAAEVQAALTVPWEHGEHVDLTGVTCNELVVLDNLDVAGFDLTGATFRKGISACGTRFQGLSWMLGVSFGGMADFSDSQFMNDARLENSTFADAVCFDRSEIRGICKLDHIVAEQSLSMKDAVSYGNFSLEEAVIHNSAQFDNTEWLGGLWFDGSVLPADCSFENTEIHGRLWIKRGKIGNSAISADHFSTSYGLTYI